MFSVKNAVAVEITLQGQVQHEGSEKQEQIKDGLEMAITTLSLILYTRFRKRNAQYQSLAADLAAPSRGSINRDDLGFISNNETTSLIENQAYIGTVQSPGGKKYGALKDYSNKKCCGNDPNCGNPTDVPSSSSVANGPNVDIEDLLTTNNRWRMHLYRGVFRGSCLVRWLEECGVARDSGEAVVYGRHLLDGRVIAHISKQHHFHDSPLLYTFI